MQTNYLPEARASWYRWAEFLRSRRLEGMAVWLLEAAGPLAVLGAQALYITGPLFRPAVPDGQIDALAGLLEDSREARQFAAFLREERSS